MEKLKARGPVRLMHRTLERKEENNPRAQEGANLGASCLWRAGRGGSRTAAQHLASVITGQSLWITADRGRTVPGWGWGCSVNMDPEGKTDHIWGI